MGELDQLVLDAAGSPVALVVVFVLIVIDGLVPALPSESITIALAAVGASTGRPALILLGTVAALAAFIGDNLSYEIGRAVTLERFWWMRRPWFVRAVTRASVALDRRVSTAVLTGRFIPGVRVAVGFAAGATGISRRVYRSLTVLSASMWSVYVLILGTIGGEWFTGRPVLGALSATALGVTVGLVVDRVLAILRSRAATHER